MKNWQHTLRVGVPTIRPDRLELGIPELRERIRVMATGQSMKW